MKADVSCSHGHSFQVEPEQAGSEVRCPECQETVPVPRLTINPDELADMFLVTLEGAYVLARIKNQSNVVEVHLELYKTYLESLFKPH